MAGSIEIRSSHSETSAITCFSSLSLASMWIFEACSESMTRTPREAWMALNSGTGMLFVARGPLSLRTSPNRGVVRRIV